MHKRPAFVKSVLLVNTRIRCVEVGYQLMATARIALPQSGRQPM
jgi:hypothetical protein